MKAFVLVVLLAIGAGVAMTHPEVVDGMVDEFLEQFNFGDPTKQHALNECFFADHKFNRLDPAERDACYRQHATETAEAAVVPAPMPPPPHLPQVNQMDLRRSAGLGRMPNNDIRAQQQTDRYIHGGR